MGCVPVFLPCRSPIHAKSGVSARRLCGGHPLLRRRFVRLGWKHVRDGQMKTELTTDSYPLAPLQQGMLFHSLSAPASGVDVEQIFCTLREPFDAAAFERAWRRMIERHAILRTSFHWHG